MKVKEAHPLDEDELYLLKSGGNTYFQNVHEFYERVKDLPVERLSHREVAWLRKLPGHIEDATEKAKNREAR